MPSFLSFISVLPPACQEEHCLSNEEHSREVTALKEKMTAYEVGTTRAQFIFVLSLQVLYQRLEFVWQCIAILKEVKSNKEIRLYVSMIESEV